MRRETRIQFNHYLQRQQELNNVPSAAEKFNIEPRVQQRLENRVQESSDFLKKINIVPVQELKGEKLGLGIAGPIASRTDTSGAGERKTRAIHTLDKTGYECKQTNYDTHIRYSTLDTWAMFPDFQQRLTGHIIKRCALDRMLIGFNGTSAEATTDLSSNQLLQDVNIGWLQKIRTDANARVLDDGKAGNKITVKKDGSGDYKNIDALVYDAYNTLLDPWYRQDTQLVAIVGRGLLHDKLFPLVNDQQAPTEKLAADILVSQSRLGRLQALAVPYFPEDAILITRLDNLSIYYQSGARRRAVQDNPKKDQIETYESSNDAFVVEDYGMACLIEKIEVEG